MEKQPYPSLKIQFDVRRILMQNEEIRGMFLGNVENDSFSFINENVRYQLKIFTTRNSGRFCIFDICEFQII